MNPGFCNPCLGLPTPAQVSLPPALTAALPFQFPAFSMTQKAATLHSIMCKAATSDICLQATAT